MRAVEQGISVATAEFQLHDYQVNKSMYDGIIQENAEAAAGIEPKPIMFRCALDGQEYDARLCKTLIVYEGNLSLLGEIVSALRTDPAKTDLTPGEK
jgi:hypothetical protein